MKNIDGVPEDPSVSFPVSQCLRLFLGGKKKAVSTATVCFLEEAIVLD